jgi:hypothetical protein
MTVPTCAIQDGNEIAPGANLRIDRAAGVSRRVRPIGTYELSGDKEHDEHEGSQFQSLGHWRLLTVAQK